MTCRGSTNGAQCVKNGLGDRGLAVTPISFAVMRHGLAERPLRGVYSKGVKTLTMFGQILRPQSWSNMRQNHGSVYIKRSPGSWGYSPKTQGCVLYRNSYEFDAFLTNFGAEEFGQTCQSFDPLRRNTP